MDRRLLLLYRRSEGRLAQRSRGISRSADGYFYVLIPLLALALSDGGGSLAQHTALAFAMERIVYWVMKNSLRRKRPSEALPDFRSTIIASDEFSFPSGHTSGAFLFSTLMCIHYGPLMLPLYLWSTAVAMSRVYLGVHFPTDTLMGAALGVIIAYAAGALLA